MNKLAANTLALAVFFGLAAADNEHVQAQATPPIRIKEIEPIGAGCDFDSVEQDDAYSDAKRQSISFRFTKYKLSITPTQTSATTNCELRIYLSVDPGIKTALNSVTFYGTANLEAGVSGSMTTLYNWAGRPVQTRSATPKIIPDGKVGRFTFLDETSVQTWSPCKNEDIFVVKSYLNLVNSKKAAGNLSVNNIETNIESTVATRPPTWADIRAGLIIDFALGACE